MFILSRISHLGERVGFLLSRAHQAGHSTPERQVRLIRRDPNEDARVPQTIHHAVAPPYFETEDKVQRASFLHAILMMFMILLAALPIAVLVAASSPIPGIISFIVMEVLILSALALLRRGYVDEVSRMIIGGMWVLLSGIIWFFGGTSNPGIYSYVVIALMAGLLLGGPTGIAVALLSGLYVWGIFVAEQHITLPHSQFLGSAGDQAIALTFDLVIASVVLGLAQRGLRDALTRARLNEHDIAEANRDLELEIQEHAQVENELRKLNEELESRVLARTSELQALSRIKDEFVSNVSHELRTPITSMKLFQDLIRRTPELANTHIDIMSRELQRLEDLVEGLLRLSRIDQGHITLEPIPLDLNALLAEYVEDRRALIEHAGLKITFSAMPNCPMTKADPDLVGQVLSILLTNATNYTPSGGHITVTTKVHLDSDGLVGFSVRDDGPGIPPEDQPHLFERFFRGSASKEARLPGTGLGLAIAQEIVQRHEGEIEVTSTGVPGEGSVFNVWLPIYEQESQPDVLLKE